MRTRLKILLLIASLSLAACSRWNDLPLLQIDLAALGPTQVAQQRMQLTWRGETHVLENVIESSPDSLQVVGLAMGLRVYSFSYDGHTLQTGPGYLPTGLSEQRILNDLLLIHMPLTSLEQALPAGWKIKDLVADTGLKTRQLWQGNDMAIEVQYQSETPWQGRSVLINHRHDYQLILDSASES
ncbi:MAG: DUF3261 domain-containing protein [Formivibrio sp.]|nr:DUF3261 domain-containing protein [Formivibrio sp.]